MLEILPWEGIKDLYVHYTIEARSQTDVAMSVAKAEKSNKNYFINSYGNKISDKTMMKKQLNIITEMDHDDEFEIH